MSKIAEFQYKESFYEKKFNSNVDYFINFSNLGHIDVTKSPKRVNIDLFHPCLTKLAFNILEYYQSLTNIAME